MSAMESYVIYGMSQVRIQDVTAPDAAPMTRAERKKVELRQEIIDTAFACFAEQGYHATGIADIAARLGIGHGTFYRYFENKRDIVDHVITDVMNRVMAALAAENSAEFASSLDEYRELTGRIAEAFIGILLDDPRVARLLLLEATGIDTDMTERVLDLLETAAELNIAYLQHGVDAGYLRTDLDVDKTARAINGMIIAAALHGIRHPDRAESRQFADAVRRLMLDGIAAAPS